MHTCAITANIRGNDVIGMTRRDDNRLNLRGIGRRRGARDCAVACPRRSERDRATISAARWSLKSLRSCLAPRCARGSHRGQSQPLAPHKGPARKRQARYLFAKGLLGAIPLELLARTTRMRTLQRTYTSVFVARPRFRSWQRSRHRISWPTSPPFHRTLVEVRPTSRGPTRRSWRSR